jgi:mRNA-degrading endonuclease RelE of RelBE toxin-antitoxin system
MACTVIASPSFARVAKKLHARDKGELDQAVKEVANDPFLGEEKRGDLAGVFVHTFKINNQDTLLAYELNPNKQSPEEVVLLGVGPHENFYTQLKRG